MNPCNLNIPFNEIEIVCFIKNFNYYIMINRCFQINLTPNLNLDEW